MPNQRGENNRNESTGLTRAVPIILIASAIFLSICFIFDGTGSFGSGITSLLRGLFAAGAYAIPALLLLHAAFFKADYTKKTVTSRIIFSLIVIIMVSSIDYTVTYFGSEPVFAPALFYSEASAGGFIGGIFAYFITTIIGPYGLIILDATVLIVYAVVFFGRKDSVTRKGVLAFLEFSTFALSLVEAKIKDFSEARKEARAERKRQETEERHRELLDDDFFRGGNMESLDIDELSIHESTDPKNAEKRPNLQNKVHNKSALSKEEVQRERRQRMEAEREAQKRASIKFDIDRSGKPATDAGSAFFGYANSGIGFSERPRYDARENASEVFTKDFDPFDFATGEKLIAKQSTRATTASKKSVTDTSSSLFSVTEESIAEMKRREANERRRADFEQRKARLFEKRGYTPKATSAPAQSPAPAPTQTPSAQTDAPLSATVSSYTAPKATPAYTPTEYIHDTKQDAGGTSPIFRKTTPHSVTTEATFGTRPEFSEMEYVSVPNEAIVGQADDEEIRKIADGAAWGKPSINYEQAAEESAIPENTVNIPHGNPEGKDFDTIAEEIAEIVRQNNPAYARSANKSTFTTTVREGGESDIHEAKPETQKAPEPLAPKAPSALPFVIEDVSYDKAEEPKKETAFKPYTPPVAEDKPKEEQTAVLVTERQLLTPTANEATDDFLGKEVARYDSFEEAHNETASLTFEEKNKEAPHVSTPTIDDALFEEAESEDMLSSAEATVPEATVFPFDEKEEDEGEEIIFGEDDKEDTSEEPKPIPPENQNPDVINQRLMFPFLDKESPIESSKETEKTEEKSGAESKEDLPPFDIEDESEAQEEPKSEEVKAVITAEEKPKKKDYSDYVIPPIDLLHPISEEQALENSSEEAEQKAEKLIDTLASFGVTASIKGVDRGPRITRYEVVPARGTKVLSILNLENDIAMNLAAGGIRMEAPIPGKTAVGIEIPNEKASLVRLRELIETEDYKTLKSKTTVCMGKDVAGQPIFADVAKMPHALVAGATGMGKSVWINSMMISILYKARPDEVKFIMIDPKQVEFTMYNGIPHLLVPVVSDVKQAAGTLMWAVEEMERRYGVLKDLCVRHIDAYNDKVAAQPSLGEPMSRIIIVIDEFAELIMQAKNPVENLIIRIAQKARAAGIHLIIGTQKPVKEVVTGLIKSNIPSKFSCKVAQNRDSILIFDTAGAEKLLDKGDMLVSFANSLQPLRVQSAFVADDEVEAVMDYLRGTSDGSSYDEDVMEEIRRAADKCSKKGSSERDGDDEEDASAGDGYLNDKQFLSAVELAVNSRKISTSLIQRKISIGYGKAAKFIDVMVDMGIVGEANGSKPREVLITPDEWYEKLARTTYDD